jgi:hypothetical protein
MPPSDFEIKRLAHHLIHRHGDKAMTKAREKVEEMRRKANQEGADLWLQRRSAGRRRRTLAPGVIAHHSDWTVMRSD